MSNPTGASDRTGWQIAKAEQRQSQNQHRARLRRRAQVATGEAVGLLALHSGRQVLPAVQRLIDEAIAAGKVMRVPGFDGTRLFPAKPKKLEPAPRCPRYDAYACGGPIVKRRPRPDDEPILD